MMEETHMKRGLLLTAGLALMLSGAAPSAQSKPVIVVQPFTTASGVDLPYDMKLMQTQLVPEFKVVLGREFDIATEAPATSQAAIYVVDAEITAWRPGNAAKRMLVGMGSGREASDIQYRVTDSSGRKVIDRKETIRTNFYAQGSGSSGTLAHPIAQKIAEGIKDAKLK
jgi:uncharacterized protein DUF4410